MNRIDLPHLVWTLESLAEGKLVNRIQVDRGDGEVREAGAGADAGAAVERPDQARPADC